MEQMRRELERTQQNGSPNWAAEFDPGMPAQGMDGAFQTPRPAGFSPAEFMRYQQMQSDSPVRTASPSAAQQSYQGYRPSVGMGYGGGMGMGMGMMNRPYSSMSYQQPAAQQQSMDKGKSRMVELDDKDWEAQFAAMEGDQTQHLDQDLDAQANRDIERELNDMDRSVLSETDEFGDFESIWRGIQAETANARQLAEDENFADGMHLGDMGEWEGFDGLNTHSNFRDPQLGDYLFEEDNLFKDVADPFGEGMRIMEEGGNLSLAALAFEAAVQKDPQHVEAWVKLGAAQAQNEKESPAIRALEQALKVDPSNLEALMGLAVSYTNEGYDSTAYRTLERWLATKYPSL
ncbi:hypothetical protein LTS18_000380, partial [Coniosporium uncinatum]